MMDFEKENKELRRLLTVLHRKVSGVREQIIKTNQRALTGVYLEQRIWEIWGHCRLNKHSLESDRHCKIIRETIDAAVADVQKRLEDTAVALKDCEVKNRELRRELKTACATSDELRLDIRSLEKRLKEVRREPCE